MKEIESSSSTLAEKISAKNWINIFIRLLPLGFGAAIFRGIFVFSSTPIGTWLWDAFLLGSILTIIATLGVACWILAMLAVKKHRQSSRESK